MNEAFLSHQERSPSKMYWKKAVNTDGYPIHFYISYLGVKQPFVEFLGVSICIVTKMY